MCENIDIGSAEGINMRKLHSLFRSRFENSLSNFLLTFDVKSPLLPAAFVLTNFRIACNLDHYRTFYTPISKYLIKVI